MDINTLYNIAENEQIHIKEVCLNEAKGMYITCNNVDVILLDKNTVKRNTEELCTLAEELGHNFKNAHYPLNCTNKYDIDKNEYRAKKWAFKQLISKEKLFELGEKGYQKHEIAEELGVTEELVEIAYNYYKYN